MSRSVITLVAAACLAPAAQDCNSLAKLALPHTTVTLAEPVAAGTFTPPVGKPLPSLPAFCRVVGRLKPSIDSEIQIEVWMPASGWNGKFQGVGNGGYAGAISYDGLAQAIAHGYATASTDTGHRATGIDASWALGHPEKIVDFGHRAIHEMTVTAKAIVRAFYGDDPKRSYFSSCSNGGRQALMEAQRYPSDYDGIVAGAPANYWTHLFANAVWNLQALLIDPKSYIPPAKLPAIQAAALTACDASDGVKDGAIENPRQCRFDPAVLECKGDDADTCLTMPQVAALKKLYAGSVFPGYPPGGEAEPGGWEPWITGAAPEKSLMFAFGTQFFKNMVFANPSWDFRTFDKDRDTKLTDTKMGPILNAIDPDLSRFRARGGKLILYHGWSDAAIAAGNAIDYYESVQAKMGANQARGFVRLFMVPAMQHCNGGSGASNFGQFSLGSTDAEHNINAALERWVEMGVAPEQVIGTSARSRTRPICAYPLIARYKGTGSTDDAANFTCSQP